MKRRPKVARNAEGAPLWKMTCQPRDTFLFSFLSPRPRLPSRFLSRLLSLAATASLNQHPSLPSPCLDSNSSYVVFLSQRGDI
jgi:hypothetical protein